MVRLGSLHFLLTALNKAEIIDNRLNPEPNSWIGGIAGYVGVLSNVYFYNCTNYVYIPMSGTGGIPAVIMSSPRNIIFDDCANFGNVNGIYETGGIIGYTKVDDVFLINNCINNGNITREKHVGGIIACCDPEAMDGSPSKYLEIFISNCKNAGNITGGDYMGGIMGSAYDYWTKKTPIDTIIIDSIEICDTTIRCDTTIKYDTLWIIITPEISRFELIPRDTTVEYDTTISCHIEISQINTTIIVDSVFRIKVNIDGCVNIGKILGAGSTYAGGIIGSLIDGEITNCTNAGIVVGNTVGGIVGSTNVPPPFQLNRPPLPENATPPLAINIYNCINTNWIDAGIGGAIIGEVVDYCNVINCFYDRQMCSKEAFGISIGNNAVSMDYGSKSTLEMVGYNLSSLPWIKDAVLYPRVGDHIIDKLAAAPIYLRNDERIDDVTYSMFDISNNYSYPFQWGFYEPSFKSSSQFDNIEVIGNKGKIVETSADWDSLVVRFSNNTSVPIFEKWVPIFVTYVPVTFDVSITCGSIRLLDSTDTTRIISYAYNGYNHYTITAKQGSSISFDINGLLPCCVLDRVLTVPPDIPFYYTLYTDKFTIIADYDIKNVHILTTSHPIPPSIEVLRYDSTKHPFNIFASITDTVPEKTNQDTVTFRVEIKRNTFLLPPDVCYGTKQELDSTDFLIYSDYHRIRVPDTNIIVKKDDTYDSIYYVSVNTKYLLNHSGSLIGHNKVSDIVKIDAVISCGNDTHYVNHPCCIDERYDVRKVFWAMGNLIYPYNSTICYNYLDSFVLKFDEPVTPILPSQGVLKLEDRQAPLTNNIDISIFELKNLPFQPYCIVFSNNTGQFFVLSTTYDIKLSGNILMDEWQNVNSTNNYPTHFTGAFHTALCKIAMQNDNLKESSDVGFTVSNATPNPAIDKTEVTINTFVEGILNVAIYDIAGTFVMDIVSNRFVNTNTDLKVPIYFGPISNGTYTIIISIDNNSIAQQIIIFR